MTPASRFSPMSSPDVATAVATGALGAGRGSMEPVDPRARVPFSPTHFELRCAQVHPFGCEELFSATSVGDVVACACAHGARVHGFTPVFYSRERLAAMTDSVAGSG